MMSARDVIFRLTVRTVRFEKASHVPSMVIWQGTRYDSTALHNRDRFVERVQVLPRILQIQRLSRAHVTSVDHRKPR